MRIFEKRPLAMVSALFLSCFALLFWAGISVKITISILCLIGFILYTLIKRKVKLISVLLLTVTIASALSACYFDGYVGKIKEIKGVKNNVVFEVEEVTYSYSNTTYMNCRLIEVDGEELDYKFHLSARYTACGLMEGEIAKGTLEFIDFPSADKGFNEEQYYRSKGIWLNAADVEGCWINIVGQNEGKVEKLINKVHDVCTDMLNTYTNEDSASLLSALVLGNRDNIEPDVKRDFERNGVSHMLSISGMHLSIIVACIMMFANIFHIRKQITVAFITALCVFYILLTNATPSILRSGIMLIIMSLAFFAGRANDSVTTLFTTLMLIVIFSPSSVFDVGLILSFSSTLGILTVLGGLSKKIKVPQSSIIKRVGLYLGATILTTVSALAFSIIPMVTYFDSFSYVTILSNLILAPVITLILSAVPLYFVIYPIAPFAAFLGLILDKLCLVFVTVMGFISGWDGITVSLKYPYTEYTLVIFVLGVVVAVAVNKKRVLLCGYVLWFAAYSALVHGYDSSYQEYPKVFFSSQGSNDALIMRRGRSTYYLDFGKVSSSSANRMFDILVYDLYATELDHWVIGKYTDKCTYTLKKYVNKEHIANIYLPEPTLTGDKAVADEIEKLALEDGVNIEYYDYNETFTVEGVELYITEPVTFEGTSVLVNSASIKVNGIDLAYYGMGYFDYADEFFSADITFVGNSGTRRKQKKSPALKCDKLIYAEKNEVAVAEFQCGDTVVLEGDDKTYSMRIGEVKND